MKYSLELGQFHIKYLPRTAIKGQVLADFIAELTFPEDPEPPTTHPEAKRVERGDVPGNSSPGARSVTLKLFTDGSSNTSGCGAGMVLVTPGNEEIDYALRLGFRAANNEAEYEALLAGLCLAKKFNVTALSVFCDSQLVLARDPSMTAYLERVKTLMEKFKKVDVSKYHGTRTCTPMPWRTLPRQ